MGNISANIEAIKLLNALSDEGRTPSDSERATLLGFSGWGAFAKVFDPNSTEHEKEREALEALLSPGNFQAVRASTPNSFYTPDYLVASMYDALAKMGFNGGRVLEPAMGTGRFFETMPPALRDTSDLTGIEYEPVTAKVAQALHPSVAVAAGRGFHEISLPNGQFDLVIGNPPFGDVRLYDPEHADLAKFRIHDYFVLKSLRLLRPGGLLALVISSGFMDKVNKEVRAQVHDHADLIAGLRLPGDVFEGTDVTTDVLFFRKRAEGEQANSTAWLNTVSIDINERRYQINEYFFDNDWRIGGELEVGYQNRLLCRAADDCDLPRMVAHVLSDVPTGIYTPGEGAEDAPVAQTITGVPRGVKVDAFYLTADEQVAQRIPDITQLREGEIQEVRAAQLIEAGKRVRQRITAMISLRDTVNALIEKEGDCSVSDTDLTPLRRELNRAYDTFVKKFGALSSEGNRRAFHEDPDYPRLMSLEVSYKPGISKAKAKKYGISPVAPTWEKADIFHHRVISQRTTPERTDNVEDALSLSLNERGGVDIAYMAKLMQWPEDWVISKLGERIFEDPMNGWTTAEEYLSGDVRQKLAIAKRAVGNRQTRFSRNVEALEAVLPEWIEAADIDVELGAAWVPASIVQGFVAHLLGEERKNIVVSYLPSVGRWMCKLPASGSVANTNTWGTAEMPASEIIERMLMNRPVKVYEVDSQGNRYIDREQTLVANNKADEIRAEFKAWIWEDDARRETLEQIYNERFASIVPREFDGSHLTFPGMASGIELRTHQKNGIWRAICKGGSMLFDHVVGAGKTFAVIASIMELRRLAIIRRAMITVPNHLVSQWAAEALRLYPSARVLAASPKDLAPARRKMFFSRILSQEWDLIIVPHSSFEKLPMPAREYEDFIKEQVADVKLAIEQVKAEHGERLSVKRLESMQENLKAKLNRILDQARDNTVDFTELNIDLLAVDEADEFKNLFFHTTMHNVLGLGNPEGSQRAMDLFIKGLSIQRQNEGRGLMFATGSPISNSIAEMQTLQRYMAYDKLKEAGLHHFDAWASVFGKIVTDWELDATGVNYKLTSRFASFKGLPELVAMYREFADVVLASDLEAQAKAEGRRSPVPPLTGGRAFNVVVPRSEQVARFFNDGIIERAENLGGDLKKDNMLAITGDARLAALDLRLIESGKLADAGIDPATVKGDEKGKLATAALNTYLHWLLSASKRGTQLVFCDLGTPNGSGFTVYEEFTRLLTECGVPRQEIAWVHDANTQKQMAELQEKVQLGVIRVLMGSTRKMGSGLNVQDRLVALHHLDAPWRPRDVEQREGRIKRQGNLLYADDPDNFSVAIYRYATERTYDARMWQVLEVKQRFIEAIRKGTIKDRNAEDIGVQSASYAEIKAAATGNPLILEQVKLASRRTQLEALERNHDRNQLRLRSRIGYLEDFEVRKAKRLAALEMDRQTRDAASHSAIVLRSGQMLEKRKELDAALGSVHRSYQKAPAGMNEPVGSYRGFRLNIKAGFGRRVTFYLQGEERQYSVTYEEEDTFSGSGLRQRLGNLVDGIESDIAQVVAEAEYEAEQLGKAKAALGAAFPHAEELRQITEEFNAVMIELDRMKERDYQPRPVEEVLGRPLSDDTAADDAGQEQGITFDWLTEQIATVEQTGEAANSAVMEPEAEGPGDEAEEQAESATDWPQPQAFEEEPTQLALFG